MSDALKGITGFEEGELRSGYTDFHVRFWCSFSLWGGGIRVYVDGILASMPTGRGKLLILISTFLKIEVLSRLFFSLYANSSDRTILATTGEDEGKPSVSLGFNTGHFSKQ
jgi:iron complex outermembrane recepter protein